MLSSFSQKLIVKEVFEAVTQPNKELKKAEFDGARGKKFKLLIYRFFIFFTKRRKTVEKVIYQKKIRGYRTSETAKSTQSSH